LLNSNLFGTFAEIKIKIKKIMLLFNYYADETDKAWFDSSNVVYAECDDSSDTQEKTVKVTFKNGLVYQYDNVNIYDWSLFKNAESQGKALNEIFKKNAYPYSKLDNKANVDELKEEYAFRSGNGMLIHVDGNGNASVYNNKDVLIYTFEDGDNKLETVEGLLKALNYIVKIKEDEQ